MIHEIATGKLHGMSCILFSITLECVGYKLLPGLNNSLFSLNNFVLFSLTQLCFVNISRIYRQGRKINEWGQSLSDISKGSQLHAFLRVSIFFQKTYKSAFLMGFLHICPWRVPWLHACGRNARNVGLLKKILANGTNEKLLNKL